ncbi:hypothetical protein [Flaviflexus equikiangi]|uniref:hypothetical protein n=1 Tax=Flaviflexus equikiangi TaxID=2758573 RepID=UPI0015F4B8BC|nr:hypothetical protein [Flaviflexus equikiangi]
MAVLSVIATFTLLLLHPSAYGIPGFNNVRDTPFSYLIGFVLGSLTATLVHPVIPAMEVLATRRVARARALLLLTATFFQGLLILGVSTLLRESLGLDLPWQHVAVFLTSTVFFLGVGFIAAGLITGPIMWIIPVGLLAIFLGFSWKDEYAVHSWNLVMNTSGVLVSVAVVIYGVGLFVASAPNPRFGG